MRAAVEQVVVQNREVIGRERELVGQDLATTRSVIDDKVRSMTDEVVRVQELVRELERDRQLKFGELASAIQHSHEQLSVLAETTQGLRQALSSTKARGQWGERMADDVLRLARARRGRQLPQAARHRGRDPRLHVPAARRARRSTWTSSSRSTTTCATSSADSELEQRRARDDFLRDVRGHVKTLAGRGYSDAAVDTVDCVLLFIPNEALYSFIHEQDRTILDDALGQKLVFCSPLTLYAVLAVVRQAVDSFRVERTSNEILARLAAFHKQWTSFVERMDKLDRSLGTARQRLRRARRHAPPAARA